MLSSMGAASSRTNEEERIGVGDAPGRGGASPEYDTREHAY